jgi:hypothetical protein
MRDFFASLMEMLATDLDSMNLGIIVHDFITDEIVPNLQDRVLRETKEKDRKELKDLLALYFKYADSKSQEGKLYDDTAVRLIKQMGMVYKIPQEDQEDLMQDIAVDFYRKGSKLGADLRDVLSIFNEMDGPIALNKYWGKILHNRVLSLYRDKILKHKERSVGLNFEHGQRQTAPMQIDERVIQGLIGGLQTYIRGKVSKPEIVDMVNLWFKAVQDHDVNMSRDIYPKVMKKYGTPESTLSLWWGKTKPLIVKYFTEALELKDERRVRELIHLGVVETVTQTEYRMKLSKWMLGSLLYAKVYGHL